MQTIDEVAVNKIDISYNQHMLCEKTRAFMIRTLYQSKDLGAYATCKKWKNSPKAPKIFKTFCAAKGW
jgi:hypothetical protein